ncbi:hypothetical protein GCM10023149_31130 [Mucilaginibacter gynuensis]|uniref:Uncharacterized protein n=1 Tax=Mucilaginibacter gynuensis TaxID=1302236 RepID=A0ABP8GNI8_9SPHI
MDDFIDSMPLYSKNQFEWKATPTDFIELVTALHESGIIKRIDGEKLTRKELANNLMQFFNIENTILNLEKLLSSRTNNKRGLTLFLNKLEQAFSALMRILLTSHITNIFSITFV